MFLLPLHGNKTLMSSLSSIEPIDGYQKSIKALSIANAKVNLHRQLQAGLAISTLFLLTPIRRVTTAGPRP